jgi:hypothetical protein
MRIALIGIPVWVTIQGLSFPATITTSNRHSIAVHFGEGSIIGVRPEELRIRCD